LAPSLVKKVASGLSLSGTTGKKNSRPIYPRSHAGDFGAERVEPFVDALIAAFDLVGVVDGRDASAHTAANHSGANVGEVISAPLSRLGPADGAIAPVSRWPASTKYWIGDTR